MISGTVNLTEKIMAFTRTVSDRPFSDVCSVASNLYVVAAGSDSTVLRRFIRGSYADNGTPFSTFITTLPINAPGGAYAFGDISSTALSIYVGDTSRVFVNGQLAYLGPPHTGHTLPGWGIPGLCPALAAQRFPGA